MTQRMLLLLLSVVALCMADGARVGAGLDSPSGGDGEARSELLLLYFTDNGQDGLHVAASHDGRVFRSLAGGRSLLKPTVSQRAELTPLMRDPSVTQTSDGTFHLVWTCAWESTAIGYTRSRDLVNWEPQMMVDVMGPGHWQPEEREHTARNAWAPDISVDEKTGRLVVVWASTVKGEFASTAESSENGYNHRLYYTTWEPHGAPHDTMEATRLHFDPGFNVIDGTVAYDAATNTHVLFFKDERRWPPRKSLHYTTSVAGPAGPWADAVSAALVNASAGFWAEGPTAVFRGGSWEVYFEKYATVTTTTSSPDDAAAADVGEGRGEPRDDDEEDDVRVEWSNSWGLVRSTDLRTWEDVSGELSGIPAGARHGTVLAVTPRTLRSLEAHTHAFSLLNGDLHEDVL